MISKAIYFPLIKTRDAELRCFENLCAGDLDCILPIYELTKSRRSRNDPDGAIAKNMRRIAKIQGIRPFILDLTTTEKYSNPQISDLMDPRGDYNEWYHFVFDTYKDLKIIPMIHVNENPLETHYNHVVNFVKKSSSKCDFLAIRIPFDLSPEEIDYLFSKLSEIIIDTNCKLIVIVDAGYIRENIPSVIELFCKSFQTLSKYKPVILYKVMMVTTFPLLVSKGHNEHEDTIDIYEENIFQGIRKELEDIRYGDYCSINTEQVEKSWGAFIPRIDVASIDGYKFSYKRYRQSEGGYIRCAKRTISDTSNYLCLNSWADDKILEASKGDPYRLNPSSWIAVRMNYYIRTRILLRQKT